MRTVPNGDHLEPTDTVPTVAHDQAVPEVPGGFTAEHLVVADVSALRLVAEIDAVRLQSCCQRLLVVRLPRWEGIPEDVS
ncbi:hypothetical protein [Streptomyces sp. NPDC005890]|uniref:hypothetical protein n=1 Tax=Streptomyces sp. NPDC005890 TaxID=3154568 RepID=UPI003407A107